jgi:hypothetical protein
VVGVVEPSRRELDERVGVTLLAAPHLELDRLVHQQSSRRRRAVFEGRPLPKEGRLQAAQAAAGVGEARLGEV